MFEKVTAALEALSKGKLIVLTDDENRENEGDLICAGAFASPQNVNFMVTHGRGVLCVPIEAPTAGRLQLAIPPGNHDPRGTAFTQSVDAVLGTTTGVSAFDRAKTIAEILNPRSAACDFYSPGHVYPLLARPGGVLERAGHTEGTVDLMRLAQLPPVGVLCEILNPDGTMARMDDLERFCVIHDLVLCTIAEIIDYRRAHRR